jgi:hypothetical protein
LSNPTTVDPNKKSIANKFSADKKRSNQLPANRKKRKLNEMSGVIPLSWDNFRPVGASMQTGSTKRRKL